MFNFVSLCIFILMTTLNAMYTTLTAHFCCCLKLFIDGRKAVPVQTLRQDLHFFIGPEQSLTARSRHIAQTR